MYNSLYANFVTVAISSHLYIYTVCLILSKMAFLTAILEIQHLFSYALLKFNAYHKKCHLFITCDDSKVVGTVTLAGTRPLTCCVYC